MREFFVCLLVMLCIAFGFNWQPRLEHYNLPFIFDVARQAVPGASFERKFGSIDVLKADEPTDVWQYGETIGAEKYTWSADGVADIDRVSSDSALDVSSVRITGLDVEGYQVVQDLTLTGQTPVALTTPLWRVNRVENNGSANYAGNIYVFVNNAVTGGEPNDPTSVRGYIELGDNQTLQSVYTVPKGKIAYVLGSEISLTKDGGVTAASVRLKTKLRAYGGVFKTKYNYSISSSGTSRSTHNPPMWIPVPELTDIEPGVIATADNLGVSYAYTVLLINE
jgi:hypothetical protein